MKNSYLQFLKYLKTVVGRCLLKKYISSLIFSVLLFLFSASAMAVDVGEFVNQNTPAAMVAGQKYTVVISMKNSGGWGGDDWDPDKGYYLAALNSTNNVWGVNRVAVQTMVTGNTGTNFVLNIVAPLAPGSYNFQWQMIHGTAWFGTPTPNAVVNVVAPSQTTATLTGPLPNSVYSGPANGVYMVVTGAAIAAPGATISKVEVLDGSSVLSNAVLNVNPTGGIYGGISLAAGSHQIQLRVTDSNGKVALSGISNVSCAASPSNQAPSAQLNFPTDSLTFVVNAGEKAVVPITGVGADYQGAVSYLELFDNQSSLGLFVGSTVDSSVALPVGDHSLRLRATDNLGAVSPFTDPVTVHVTTDKVPPKAAVMQPSDGFVYKVPAGSSANATVDLVAQDVGGGTIAKLELLDGDTVIATGSGNQLAAHVPLSLGAHALRSRATNNAGTIGISDVRVVSVVPDSNIVFFASIGQTATVGGVQPGQKFNAGLNAQVYFNTIVSNAYDTVRLAELREGTSVLASQPFTVHWDSNNNARNETRVIALSSDFSIGVHQIYLRVYTLNSYSDTPLYTVTVNNINRPPTVALAAPLPNSLIIVPQSLVASVPVVATAADSDGGVALLELLEGNTVLAQSPSPNLNTSVSLGLGTHTVRLRATDIYGAVAYGDNTTLNVRQGALLGAVTGIRTNRNGDAEVVGWVCQDTMSQGLAFQVTAFAPAISPDATTIGSGVANVTTEPDNSDIQSQCHTPGAGHHFVFSLAGYDYAGAPLYVQAQPVGGGTAQVLPCAGLSCNMPGSLRIGLINPANNDVYLDPATVFMSAKISGGSGVYDEVAFAIDGAWNPGTPDAAPDTYYASRAGLSPRSTPYVVQSRVRQGNRTIYSAPNLITILAADAVSLVESSPADGSASKVGSTILLSAKAVGNVATIQTVKFYANGALVGNGANGNGVWSTNWNVSVAGTYSITAQAFDSSGRQLAASAGASVTVSEASSQAPPVPVIVTPPPIGTQDAGSLPGALAVGPNGDATYSMALVTPPGTAGMQPALALSYSSSGTNGIVGLGWSLSGLSSIHRCGKTIAQDNVNAPIGFTTADRLCLDGQRLVRVNPAIPSTADQATQDAAYWAAGGEYRTELDSLSRITAVSGVGGAPAFKVEGKDGKIRYYGCDVGSSGCAGTNASNSFVAVSAGALYPQDTGAPNKVGQAISWALSSIMDRSGNHIDFDYSLDAATGEHLPKQVRYGGNFKKPQNHYAAVRFSYLEQGDDGTKGLVRPDAWTRYIADARNDLRHRLFNISTYISTAGAVSDSSGTLVRQYTLAYEQSPSSGRSLLDSVTVCATDSAGLKTCQLPTTFNWGKPSTAARAFTNATPGKGFGGTNAGDCVLGIAAPCIVTHGVFGNNGNYVGGSTHIDYFDFSDFENNGRTDILEKRVADAYSDKWTIEQALIDANSNPSFAAGTLQNQYHYFHNTGTGYTQYNYKLNTGKNFVVLAVSDFNGDGYPDLLVFAADGNDASAVGESKVCLSPLSGALPAPGATLVFNCDSGIAGQGDNGTKNQPFVMDVVGDGRAAVYGKPVWAGTDATATLCIQGTCTAGVGNLPSALKNQSVPWYQLDTRPDLVSYTGMESMVDLSGTGKPELVQWSQATRGFVCVGADCTPCKPTDSNPDCMTWHAPSPQVLVSAFAAPGVTVAAPLLAYQPVIPNAPTNRRAYVFDAAMPFGQLAGDFNGSGYSSLFFGYGVTGLDQNKSEILDPLSGMQCLSTGQHLDCTARQALSSSSAQNSSGYMKTLAVADFDGDGQPDLLMIQVDNRLQLTGDTLQLCHLVSDQTFNLQGVLAKSGVQCEPWTVDGITPAQLRAALIPPTPQSQVDQLYVMDIKGTGRPQLVYYHAGTFSCNCQSAVWNEDGRWEVFEPNDLAKDGEALDRIVSVKNGWGGGAAVTYGDAIKDNLVGQSGGSALKYPQHLSPRTGKIVSALTTHIGVDPTGADVHTQVFNYHYWDAATDAAGRGSLGFGLVSVQDMNSGITTDTVYQQAWPLAGMVQSVTSFNSKGTLSSTSNAFQVLSLNGGATSCPYVSGSTTVRNDLDNLLPLGQTDTTTVVDSYCNVQQSTMSSWTDANKKYVTDTLSTLNNLPDTWQIGQVVKVQTSKTDPDSGSVIRRIGYGYNLTTGLLESETVEPDATVADYAQYQLTTSYGRDPNFGMVTTVSQDWADPAGYTANWGAVATCQNNSPHHRVVSSTVFDAQGRFPQKVSNALCQSQSFGYDAGTGAQVSVTDPNNLTTTRTVDGFGRLLKEVAPDNNETRHYLKTCDGVACPLGASVMQVVEFFNGASRTRPPQVAYSDYAGHVLRSQSWGLDTAHAIVADQRYDGSGRLQEADWPRFDNADAVLARHLDYDALNRVVRLITYDEAGKPLINQTDYLGLSVQLTNPLLYTRTEKHNVLGQLKEVVDAKNGSTRFGYEPFGNLATATDPNNNVITVVYDRWGHKTELHDPDLGFIQYQVDPVGMTWAQVSPRQRVAGSQTTMKYDPLNRMTARDETDLLSRWVYDTAVHGVGQLAEAYTANASGGKDYDRTHAYTDKGLPQSTTQVIGTGTAGTYVSTTAYDSWNRPMTQSYQHGADAAKVFGLAYGQTGGVEQVTRGSLVLWQLTEEDASRRATSMALGNGLTEVKNYDIHTGRLMNGGMNTAAATVRLLESYQYDVLGSVLQRNLHWSTGGFSETFSYDELNRLKTSQVGNNALLTYQYDAAGSIQSKTDVANNAAYLYPAQGVDAKQYDVQGLAGKQPHALMGLGTLGGFAYDLNGNQSMAPGRSATWTSFDMPLQLVKGGTAGSDCGSIGGTGSCFNYGPEHQRVKQTRSDGTTIVYAGGQELETDNHQQVTVRTYWPLGVGVEIDRPNATATELNWRYVDNLGSPVALTDEQGGLREQLEYDPWGKRRSTVDNVSTADSIDGKVDNKGYTGHEMLDQLDLVHMNGRVYDPYTAKFLSADPHVTDPTNGQNYNRYSYVLNNPTNLTDPTGFDWRWTQLTMGWGSSAEAADRKGAAEERAAEASATAASGQRTNSSGTNSDNAKNGGSLANNDRAIVSDTQERIGESNDGSVVVYERKTIREPAAQHTYGTADQVMGQWINFDLISRLGQTAGLSERHANWLSLASGFINPRSWVTSGESFMVKAANGCSCCFPAGTPVLTVEGEAPIETVKVGDLVYARDAETGETSLKPVTALILTEGKPLYELVTRSSTGEFARLEVTDNHPFWVEGKGWIEAAKLQQGMVLTDFDKKPLRLVVARFLGRMETTYNFTVQDKHTYFAGMQHVLVHNCSCLVNGLKKAATEAEGAAGKMFSKEKQSLVEMAKADKKAGMTAADMEAYKELNSGLPDPFPSNKVRGPEAHSSGAPSSQSPHGHVGPVDHIPIVDD